MLEKQLARWLKGMQKEARAGKHLEQAGMDLRAALGAHKASHAATITAVHLCGLIKHTHLQHTTDANTPHMYPHYLGGFDGILSPCDGVEHLKIGQRHNSSGSRHTVWMGWMTGGEGDKTSRVMYC